jgi:hypothetical protein
MVGGIDQQLDELPDVICRQRQDVDWTFRLLFHCQSPTVF